MGFDHPAAQHYYCKHFYIYPRFPERVSKIVCFAGNAYYTKDEVDGLVGLKDVSKWSERMRKPMEEIYGKVSMKDRFQICKAFKSKVLTESLINNRGGL